MDHYKKERSSRHHLKIELQNNGHSQESQQDGLLLTNPMACVDPSPVGAHKATSPGKHDVHFILHNSISPPVVTELSQNSNHSRSNSIELSNSGSISRGTSINSDRSSFRDKSKSRPKSASMFRFFAKGNSSSANTSLTNSPMTGNSSRKSIKRHSVNMDQCEDEIDYGGDASSQSDHEDPFSPRGISGSGDMIANRHATESPKSTSSVEQNTSLPRQQKRHVRSSSSVSGQYTCRDSGFSSERESVSHTREEIFEDARCSLSPGPLTEEYRSAGMDALESLHNQLQILVKQNAPSEESDSVAVYEEVIASLSSQLEDVSNTVDTLRQSDNTLRLSLRLAEQRTLEAETKLQHTLDRCQRGESRYSKLHSKHQALYKKHKELEKYHQKQSLLHNLERAPTKNSSPPISRSALQRVHSQTQFDRSRSRPDSAPSDGSRPNTAQGFHEDQAPTRKISSMSHTETCV